MRDTHTGSIARSSLR